MLPGVDGQIVVQGRAGSQHNIGRADNLAILCLDLQVLTASLNVGCATAITTMPQALLCSCALSLSAGSAWCSSKGVNQCQEHLLHTQWPLGVPQQ